MKAHHDSDRFPRESIASRIRRATEGVFLSALTEKVASQTGSTQEAVRIDRPTSEMGLDSLLVAELSAWIENELRASISISEILDAPSVRGLVQLLAERSSFLNIIPEHPAQLKSNGVAEGSDETAIHDMQPLWSNGTQDAPAKTPDYLPDQNLPMLPLPDLQSTLQAYQYTVSAFGSAEELEHTSQAIMEFQKPGSIGTKLQDRLIARKNDPKLDCWQADLYNSSNFLDRKYPLVPFGSFFYTHHLSPFEHGQAERAAIIAVAAFRYKEILEAGEIKPTYLHGQPTCMTLFQWIFNVSRKPCLGTDIMEKFPGNDYVIVLRRGRVFKVSLKEGSRNKSYAEFKATFTAILSEVDDRTSWVGIMTADDRRTWAKVTSRSSCPEKGPY